jgi:hypothetical protein
VGSAASGDRYIQELSLRSLTSARQGASFHKHVGDLLQKRAKHKSRQLGRSFDRSSFVTDPMCALQLCALRSCAGSLMRQPFSISFYNGVIGVGSCSHCSLRCIQF